MDRVAPPSRTPKRAPQEPFTPEEIQLLRQKIREADAEGKVGDRDGQEVFRELSEELVQAIASRR